MAGQKNRTEITSADKQQLGFEYQYLYFIVRLLSMQPNEEVGYESLDDVHVISSKEDTVYIQVKHTTETAADGKPSNLTRLSEDLWKTLSNWYKLVSDPTENRSGKDEQKEFLSKSHFILVTNRNVGANEIVDKIEELKNGTLKASELKKYLSVLSKETKDSDIKGYIDDVNKLPTLILSAFLTRVEFQSTKDSIFSNIRNGIRSKMIDQYVDEVLAELYLKLKEEFFSCVKEGEHQVLTYSEWWKSYTPIFNKYRTTLLPFHHYVPLLPDHLEQQCFVRELLEIGAIDMGDLSEITELTEYYLSVELQLDDWKKEGRITDSTIKDFHKEAALIWKRIHQSSHRKTKQDISLDYANALSCFDEVMKEKLNLISTDIGLPLSNGEFVKLANEEKIGWKYSWRSRRDIYEA